MGAAYATVHLVYAIPPALFLWRFFRRIRSARDVFLTTFLVTVAMVSTTPWDSHLIRSNVWTYPPNAILGPKLFDIPAEEVFFFFIQTYITSQIYLVASKPVLHPTYLPRPGSSPSLAQWLGGLILGTMCASGFYILSLGGEYTYLGLTMSWAGPFLLFLWTMASSHLTSLPLTSRLLPATLPTLYRWLVDTLALQRGTWAIVPGTKTGWFLWPHLEVEEALFFGVTNAMIVFGMAAGDKAFAVCDALGWDAGAGLHTVPLLVRALFTSLDQEKLKTIELAYDTLAKKEHGKSFLAASMFFPGPQRIGLLQLYALCRICDNLIDDAPNATEATRALGGIRAMLVSGAQPPRSADEKSRAAQYPAASYELDPVSREELRTLNAALRAKVPQVYIEQLLAGFQTDLSFTTSAPSAASSSNSLVDRDGRAGAIEDEERFPIRTNADLLLYSQQVAGAVAAMCVYLLWPSVPADDPPVGFADDHDLEDAIGRGGKASVSAKADSVLYHAQRAGRALQLVNIARDIRVDARDGARCYIPATFLAEHDTTPARLTAYLRARIAEPATISEDPTLERTVRAAQEWMVRRARAMYASSGSAIARMPRDTRGGLRAAVEQYLSLGDALLAPEGEGVMRVRVPKVQRVRIAWRAAGKA